MSKTKLQITILFGAFTLAGFLLAGGIAPRFEGYTQLMLIVTGLSLFSSGLTAFLIKFIGENND